MNKKINEIINQLTLEEKAGLCSGSDFWHLKSVERLGLSKIMVTDGPHGLRKQGGESDHIGLQNSVPATCFPTAVTTACSWDVDLIYEMGEALGEECLQEDVSVILGPGANIKRSPLCGRNFEYISEDPYHTGTMAAALINGIQSKGVGTSLKHYAMNNQETRRMTIDAVVDERTQREIYLAGFERAVKYSQPWTVMCSYNKVDSTYLSDYKRFLTDILKEEWGHTGLVVTDWGACNNRVEGIKAGLELEMPTSWGKNDEKIVNAVNDGMLSIELLDKAVERIIQLILKSQENRRPEYKYDKNAHHSLARRIAEQSAVLLKNDSILPMDKESKVAIIGEFAKKTRYQGAGSSIINPYRIDNICSALDEAGINYDYAAGYNIKTDTINTILIEEAKKLAGSVEKVILAAGLTDNYESEGFDRTHLRMPDSHNTLIKEIVSVNPNVVVVLMNGAPIEMPWLDNVKGVLECYLSGQAGGSAIIDILYGDINPSGKLAETFPVKLEDTPSYKYFPGHKKTVEYRESIYVGYRYYDKAHKDVLFPFGFGLSYTEFEYSNIKVEHKDGYNYDVSVSVKNTGSIAGAEVVQLYVGNSESSIYKAEKELSSFKKVFIEPGECKELVFNLGDRSFAFYNINIPGWHVEKGDYTIKIGASSRDIRLEQVISLEGNSGVAVRSYKEAAPCYYSLKDEMFEVDEKQFREILGRELPVRDRKPDELITENAMLGDTTHKFAGRMMLNIMKKQVGKMLGESDGEDVESGRLMMEAVIKEMPIRVIGMMGGDRLPKYFTEGFVNILNGHLIKGIGLMLKKK
ncbi:MAG: glycoside hydrolase family 3 C-terminal domain-containing protein [Clostridiales bacterium]|nr:glycoside hydrolase family 3 C-terminal domain-containing protein [Clostridiales bacterium]